MPPPYTRRTSLCPQSRDPQIAGQCNLLNGNPLNPGNWIFYPGTKGNRTHLASSKRLMNLFTFPTPAVSGSVAQWLIGSAELHCKSKYYIQWSLNCLIKLIFYSFIYRKGELVALNYHNEISKFLNPPQQILDSDCFLCAVASSHLNPCPTSRSPAPSSYSSFLSTSSFSVMWFNQTLRQPNLCHNSLAGW